MKKSFYIISILIFAPLPAFAQEFWPECFAGGECTLCDVVQFIITIANFILSITGSVALLFIIIAGIAILTSAGNRDKLAWGKSTFFNALIGLMIILGAYAGINYIIYFFTQEQTEGVATILRVPWQQANLKCPKIPAYVPPTPTATPAPTGATNDSWQVTYYVVANESDWTGTDCTIVSKSNQIIEKNASCQFMRDVAIQGTGRTRSGQLIRVDGRTCAWRNPNLNACRFYIETCVLGAGGCIQDFVNGAANIVPFYTVVEVDRLKNVRVANTTLSGSITVKDRGADTKFGRCPNNIIKHIDHFVGSRANGKQIRSQVPGYGDSVFNVKVAQNQICAPGSRGSAPGVSRPQ